jgi:hypothetical protein
MSEDPKQYTIRTISDMHAIPDESVGAFLIDLAHWMTMCREVKDTENIQMVRDTFEWIDDGVEGLSQIRIQPVRGEA